MAPPEKPEKTLDALRPSRRAGRNRGPRLYLLNHRTWSGLGLGGGSLRLDINSDLLREQRLTIGEIPEGAWPRLAERQRAQSRRIKNGGMTMEGTATNGAPPIDPAALQEFATNTIKAAAIAQTAIMETVGRMDPASIAPPPAKGPDLAAMQGLLAAASDPNRLIETQTALAKAGFRFWGRALDLFGGGAQPDQTDKRFSAEPWRHPFFEVLQQGYAANAEWLNAVAEQVEFGKAKTNRRAQFLTRVVTDLFSPSNFLASNPEALAEALRTNGASLVRGMENFAADLRRGGGTLSISQTDMSQFKVGENLAVTPGKVVFQNDLLQLIQYEPATAQVREIPLLITTAFINKYYILDLKPANSMVRWLTEQGFTVFVTSWVNPDPSHAEATFDDYMVDGLLTAVGKVIEQTGTRTVNVAGYCISGTLLACALAYLAAVGVVSPINSATFFAAQQDFSDAGDLALFVDEDTLPLVEQQMDRSGGILPGSTMGDAFNLLRANDLIFSFLVNNYLLGRAPRAFDLLFWNSDQTRMPRALGLWYLRSFYQENALATGKLELGGTLLDLAKVTTPVFVQAAREDHIAPAESVYRGALLFGGPATFVLAGSGHIAGVVNHPAASKYQHWTNASLPGELDQWKAGAEETKGSWWPAWATWLHERSGGFVDARDPSAGPLAVIEDAPGSFVQVMS